MSVRLLYLDELMELPSMTWLVDDMLPSRGLALLWGKPGVGKSFVTLDLALTLATGLGHWHERAINPGRVLYIAAEGFDGQRDRFDAWDYGNGPLPPAGDRYAVADGIDLLRPGSADELIELATQRTEELPVLTVVDTLARCMPGGDENGPKDMSTAIATLDRLRELTGGAVLVVHHPGRSGGSERGHSSLYAALDVSMRLARRAGGVLELTCEKMKDAPEFPAMSLRLEPTGRSCVVRTATAPMTVDANDHGRQIIDYLRSVGEPQSKSAIADAVHGKRQTILDLVTELANDPEMPVAEVRNDGAHPKFEHREQQVPFP